MSSPANRIVTIYIGDIGVEVGKQMWGDGSMICDMPQFNKTDGKPATLFVNDNNTLIDVMKNVDNIVSGYVKTLDGFILIGDFDNKLFGNILSSLKEEYQHVSFLTINIDLETPRVLNVDRHQRTISNISNINKNSDSSILLRLDTTVKQIALPKNTTRLTNSMMSSKLSYILQCFIWDTFSLNTLQDFVIIFSSNGPKWGSIGVHESEDSKLDEEKRKIYAFEGSCLDFSPGKQKYIKYIKNNNITLCVSNNTVMKKYFDKLNFNNELDEVMGGYLSS